MYKVIALTHERSLCAQTPFKPLFKKIVMPTTLSFWIARCGLCVLLAVCAFEQAQAQAQALVAEITRPIMIRTRARRHWWTFLY